MGNTIEIKQFLKERENRFKPNDPAISELKRIDKIDFSRIFTYLELRPKRI
jgi:hypothetical protein